MKWPWSKPVQVFNPDRGRITVSGNPGPVLWHRAHYKALGFTTTMQPHPEGLTLHIWAKEW